MKLKNVLAYLKSFVTAPWGSAFFKVPPKDGPGDPLYWPIPCEFVGGNLVRISAGYRMVTGRVLAAPFIIDGGSMPTIQQIVTRADRFGKYLPAFLEHDYDSWMLEGPTDPKLAAAAGNLRFRYNLILLGMPEQTADQIYQAVSSFGDDHFAPEAYPGEANDPRSPQFLTAGRVQ